MFECKRVLAVIPARGGSKGLPRKNILKVKGKPLIWYSYEAALKSAFIDLTILSTDDDEIIEEAKRFEINAPFKRPAELASDNAETIDTILHACSCFPEYKYVVLLQPTSPMRLTSDIDQCFELLHSTQAPACVTVCEQRHKPEWMFKVNENFKISPLIKSDKTPTRRQNLTQVHALNGSVYIARVDWLKNTKSFTAEGCVAKIMPASRSIDIDTQQDLDYFSEKING